MLWVMNAMFFSKVSPGFSEMDIYKCPLLENGPESWKIHTSSLLRRPPSLSYLRGLRPLCYEYIYIINSKIHHYGAKCSSIYVPFFCYGSISIHINKIYTAYYLDKIISIFVNIFAILLTNLFTKYKNARYCLVSC